MATEAQHRVVVTHPVKAGEVPKTPDLLAASQAAKNVETALKDMQGAKEPQPVGEDGIALYSDNSVLIEVPNPRGGPNLVVEVGPPAASTTFLVTKILAESTQGQSTLKNGNTAMTDMSSIKAALYVRAINGQVFNMPLDMAGVQQLANVLGDIGFDLVFTAVNRFWGMPADGLKIVKKNLRGQ